MKWKYSMGIGIFVAVIWDQEPPARGWGLWEWLGGAGWRTGGNLQPDPSLHWEKWELWWEGRGCRHCWAGTWSNL